MSYPKSFMKRINKSIKEKRICTACWGSLPLLNDDAQDPVELQKYMDQTKYLEDLKPDVSKGESKCSCGHIVKYENYKVCLIK